MLKEKKPIGALAALVCIALIAPHGADAKLKSKGQLSLEARGFLDDDDPSTVDQGLGLFGRLEAKAKQKWLGLRWSERFRAFGRLDQQDAGRTVFVVEELWGEIKAGPLRLGLGADLLNWTATEAFHPADIVNARNIDSDIENYEKLGEPMASLSLQLGHGAIAAYFMPYHSQPILPSRRSRLNFVPSGIDLGPTLRVLRGGRVTADDFGLQGALRVTQSIGGADLGVHAVHHVDRSQPEVALSPATGTVHPLFRTVTQLGGTYQQVLGDFVFKLEAGYRMFVEPQGPYVPVTGGAWPDRDHLQVAGGIEYGLVHANGWESTIIAEAQSLFFADEAMRRALHIFQRDALLGYRLSLGDVSGTEFLATAIVDLEDPAQTLLNASIKRRLSDVWALSLAVRLVFGPSASTGGAGGTALIVPPDSDHVRVFLIRYF